MPSSVSDGSRPPSSCLIFSYSCGVMPCSRISSGVIEEFAVETMADFRLPIVSISDQSRAKDASIKMEICPPGFGILFSHFPPRLGRVCAFSSQGLIFRYSECPYDGGNPQRSQTTRGQTSCLAGGMGIVVVLAFLKFLFHLYFNNRYGYFRDEFDYIICGN